MSIEDSMASYYLARAAEYERIYQKPERQDDLRQLRCFVQSTFAGTEVLEVACGTGYWTEILARSAAAVTALDIQEDLIAIARSRLADPKKVTFVRADAYVLPGFQKRFTSGLSAFWWSHVANNKLANFLRGLHRSFAPGARVAFIDNVYVEGSSTPISRRDANGNTYQIRRLDDGSQHEVLKNFPTETELRAAVDAFATDVRVQFLKYYWILSYGLP